MGLRKASGTKPSMLASKVPTEDVEIELDQSMADAGDFEIDLPEDGQTGQLSDLQSPEFASAVAPALEETASDLQGLVETEASVAGSAAGLAAGAAAGLPVMAGAAIGAGLNTVLAPQYRDIAESILDKLGVKNADERDRFRERVEAGMAETIGLILPGYFGRTGVLTARSAAEVAKSGAGKIAQNLEAAADAEAAGISVRPEQAFEGTAEGARLAGGVQSAASGGMGQNLQEQVFDRTTKEIDSVDKAFRSLRDQFGDTTETVYEKGIKTERPIVQRENFERRLQKKGELIGEMNNEALELARDRQFNPNKIVNQFKEFLNMVGVNSGDGHIPASVINSLPSEAKPFAQNYNRLLSQTRVELGPEGFGTPSSKVSDMTEGSVGRSLPLNEPAQYGEKGITLDKIFALTKEFQEMANFASMNRDFYDKGWGKIAGSSKSLRDETVSSVFDEAASSAQNPAIKNRMLSKAERLRNLNSSYSSQKEAYDKFSEEISNNRHGSVIALIEKPSPQEFDALWSGMPTKEREAMASNAFDYLSSVAEKEGSDLNLSAVKNKIKTFKQQTVSANGKKFEQNRLETVMGKERFDGLNQILDIGINLEKTRPNVAAAASEGAAKRVVQVIKSAGLDAFAYTIDELLLGNPALRRKVNDLPAYKEMLKESMSGKPKPGVLSGAVPKKAIAGGFATKSMLQNMIQGEQGYQRKPEGEVY